MLDPSDSEPLRVEVPAHTYDVPVPPIPAAPPLGRVRTVRHCTHREDGQHCDRCDDLRAGESRLRAIATIVPVLAADDDFRRHLDHERRRWLDVGDRHDTQASNEQHPAVRREQDAERARVARGRAAVFAAVLGLHTPTVTTGEQARQGQQEGNRG